VLPPPACRYAPSANNVMTFLIGVGALAAACTRHATSGVTTFQGEKRAAIQRATGSIVVCRFRCPTWPVVFVSPARHRARAPRLAAYSSRRSASRLPPRAACRASWRRARRRKSPRRISAPWSGTKAEHRMSGPPRRDGAKEPLGLFRALRRDDHVISDPAINRFGRVPINRHVRMN